MAWHWIFFILALVLLLVEVLHGWALGIYLSGAMTCAVLGGLNYGGWLVSLNAHLATGAVVFALLTFLVVRVWGRRMSRPASAEDVNTYDQRM